MTPGRPRLAFVGPALGHHDGWVTTQGEVLAGLFTDDGFTVRTSSDQLSPLRRAGAHVRDLVRWRRDVDVVVVSVFSGRAFALADEALTLARALGLPRVAWLHGGALPEFGPRHPRWVRRVLTSADAVVAPSAYLARWADTIVPGSQVVPNVLDLQRYDFVPRRPRQPRLLWMRTFQELYDPATAVRGLAALRRQGVDARLTMAGQDKGLAEPMRALVADLALGPYVTFPGFVSGEEKTRLLAEHDVFVNTNLVDNAPVTVLEAAASGLAVVSTRVGGIADLLADGVAASLVPPSDPEALATAVADLLEHPEQADRQVTAAREVATRSAWPAVRDQWLTLVDTLT